MYLGRLGLALALLLGVGPLLYLNQVGLPDFLKRPLLERLRARGIDLEFSRLRLSWRWGIVAEQVRFGQADRPFAPHASFVHVRVGIRYRALLHRQLEVDALTLRQGQLVWPIPETNGPPRRLTLDHIQTELRFLPDDEWALDNFNAGFRGANLQVSGALTHASAARDWKFLQPRPAPEEQATREWQARLRALADTLDQIHFAQPPELRLDASGDALDSRSFKIHLFATAAAAQTPWGDIAQGQFSARLLPGTSNEPSRVELGLLAASAQTRWANVTNFHFILRLPWVEDPTNLSNARLSLAAVQAQGTWASAANLHLELALAPAQDQTGRITADFVLTADRLKSEWGVASNARVTGQWQHALTNPIPLWARSRLECGPIETQWGRATQAQLQARASFNPAPRAVEPRSPPPHSGPSASPRPDWGGWERLEPYAVDWEGRLEDARLKELAVHDIAASGIWRPPALTLTNFHATLRNGHVDLRGTLDMANRALKAEVSSDADPRQMASLLPEDAARWVKEAAWGEAPRLTADLELVLPAWTNRQPDWREVLPTLHAQGQILAPKGGAFKEFTVAGVQSHFSYSHQCLQLPDLVITRREGRLAASFSQDWLSQKLRCRLVSSLDPSAVRPLLPPEEQSGLDLFSFTQPPVIEAEIHGSGGDPKRLGIQGRVLMTNFTFRGESATRFETELLYSNQVLELGTARLRRGSQRLEAERLVADFNVQKIFLTNGFSTTEPMVVARAIGPPTAKAIEPFHFITVPTVRVHGIIPMHGEADADLHFQVAGGEFHWLYFNVPRVAAELHWAGLRLFLTNAHVDFYGGQAEGAAAFFFDPTHPGADFGFSLSASNALLQALMADVFARTNRLEGRLSGNLVIIGANTENWRQTQGYGALDLRDGLIWDIPIFGVFSPALDALAPGLGSSRANSAGCKFAITNGIIHSDNLEIHSPVVNLRYQGNVDLQGKLNARVEAQPLRDVPFFGRLFSTPLWLVTKLFEYKITGTIDHPKTEPVYLLPRLFGLPFHPWRTLKGMLPEETPGNRPHTNAAPVPRR